MAAKVAITYDVPTANLSTSSIAFSGTQPLGVASAEQTVTVTNNGSAPLVVSGASVSGADPGDYLINDRCRSPVSVGASCVVGVRFAPQVQGPSSAMLALQTNTTAQPAPSRSPAPGARFRLARPAPRRDRAGRDRAPTRSPGPRASKPGPRA